MAYTVVQKKSALKDAGQTLAFDNPVTLGNTLIATLTAYNSGTGITGRVFDNVNVGDWTQDAYISQAMQGTETETVGIYHKDVALAGTTTVTFGMSSSIGGSLCTIEEVSGLASSALDQSGTNFDVSTTSSASVSASAPNASSQGYAVSALAIYGGANMAIVPTSPFTEVFVSNDGTATNPSETADKAISSSETTACAWTHSHSTQVGWVAALATFKLAVAPVVPTITSQPANQPVAASSTASFSVSATASAGSLSYQWKLNGSNISGATSSSYTTGLLSAANNGDAYSCAVTDSNGTVTSAVGRVFIKDIDQGKGMTGFTGWAARNAMRLGDPYWHVRRKS
jgi:hypothetical protein